VPIASMIIISAIGGGFVVYGLIARTKVRQSADGADARSSSTEGWLCVILGVMLIFGLLLS
jgi:hypothetical protein